MNPPFRQAAGTPLRGEKTRILGLFSARSADFSRMSGGLPSLHGGFSRRNSTRTSKSDSLLEQRLLPFTRFSRAEDCLDYGHVSNRPLKWNWQLRTLPNACRKHIRLDRMLVANFEFQNLRSSTRGIGAVVNKYPARLIGRCIEWNLDFD
jgi:hypothetical protein